VLLPWFFLTPIIYEFGSLPGVDDNPTVASALYWANPLTPVISAIRDPLFAGTLPRWQDALYACLAGVAALALGAIVFRRVDDQLAAEL
jgi:ABC-type polysaccharide/polyol phosphate export permease